MKKLKSKSLLMIILLIILLGNISLAAESQYSVNMYPNKTDLIPGDIVIIPVRIEDIETENGIVAYDAILKYDEEVFEDVKITKVVNWEEPTITGRLITAMTEDMEGSNEDQDIMKISLKVKSSAKSGNTEIELSKFDATDGENTISNIGATTELNITNDFANIKEVNLSQENQEFVTAFEIEVSLIIAVVTVLIIILLIVYYVEHKTKINKEIKNTKEKIKEDKLKNEESTKEEDIEKEEITKSQSEDDE